MLASDFFKEVEAHYHQQFFSVIVEQTFVIGDIFMIGFGDSLPKSPLLCTSICRLDSFPVIVGHKLT